MQNEIQVKQAQRCMFYKDNGYNPQWHSHSSGYTYTK